MHLYVFRALVYFLVAVIKYRINQIREGRVYSGGQFESVIHHGGEGMLMRTALAETVRV